MVFNRLIKICTALVYVHRLETTGLRQIVYDLKHQTQSHTEKSKRLRVYLNVEDNRNKVTRKTKGNGQHRKQRKMTSI